VSTILWIIDQTTWNCNPVALSTTISISPKMHYDLAARPITWSEISPRRCLGKGLRAPSATAGKPMRWSRHLGDRTALRRCGIVSWLAQVGHDRTPSIPAMSVNAIHLVELPLRWPMIGPPSRNRNISTRPVDRGLRVEARSTLRRLHSHQTCCASVQARGKRGRRPGCWLPQVSGVAGTKPSPAPSA
jgi:hypothetical protein